MSDKSELINIAAELQRTVDRLLECAKEKTKDKDDDNKDNHTMIGAILKKKMADK